MSATLWIDTEADETVELGGTLAAYAAFSELAHAAGEEWTEDYPDLSGVLTQCESQEDADPDWLADVYEQAKKFLATHGDDVSEGAAHFLAKMAIAIEPYLASEDGE